MARLNDLLVPNVQLPDFVDSFAQGREYKRKKLADILAEKDREEDAQFAGILKETQDPQEFYNRTININPKKSMQYTSALTEQKKSLADMMRETEYQKEKGLGSVNPLYSRQIEQNPALGQWSVPEYSMNEFQMKQRNIGEPSEMDKLSLDYIEPKFGQRPQSQLPSQNIRGREVMADTTRGELGQNIPLQQGEGARTPEQNLELDFKYGKINSKDYAGALKDLRPPAEKNLRPIIRSQPNPDDSDELYDYAFDPVTYERTELGKSRPQPVNPYAESNFNLRKGQADQDAFYKFYDRYEKAVKPAKEGYEAARKLDTVIGDVSKASPIEQVAAIFDFMKSLDPTSTVRESEYQLPRGATDVWSKINGAYDRYTKGDAAAEDVLKQMKDLGRKLAKYHTESLEAGNKRMETIARSRGVTDFESIFYRPQAISQEQPRQYSFQEKQALDWANNKKSAGWTQEKAQAVFNKLGVNK